MLTLFNYVQNFLNFLWETRSQTATPYYPFGSNDTKMGLWCFITNFAFNLLTEKKLIVFGQHILKQVV